MQGRAKERGGACRPGSALRRSVPTRLGTVVIAAAAVGALAFAMLGLAGCATEPAEDGPREDVPAVNKISAEDAHGMMTSDRVVVLDVRTQEEYDEKHIVNARLLTLDTIDAEAAAAVAPDKDEPVFVYCRTGVRSAEAAQKLVDLGYEQVYDFGGITSWPYDTVSGADTSQAKGTVENDQLPVGVKVVCGKTRAVPEEDTAD